MDNVSRKATFGIGLCHSMSKQVGMLLPWISERLAQDHIPSIWYQKVPVTWVGSAVLLAVALKPGILLDVSD